MSAALKLPEAQPLAYGEALRIIGGLSKTSKMPGWSWSISAEDCVTGGKLREIEGSTCSSCYALKGMYTFKNVKAAHQRRMAALADPQFEDAFVAVLNHLYDHQRKRETRFRWFDAGDLQSVEVLEMINRIAARTPLWRHWLPTRETMIVKKFFDRKNKRSANLQIRISAPMVGQSFKVRPMGLPFSTVDVTGENIHQCPAYQQGNKCGPCDACWTDKLVNYPLH